jgi:hypothetical protein
MTAPSIETNNALSTYLRRVIVAKQKTVYLLVPAKGIGEDQKTFFNRAGVAFENRDGSLNVKLDMFPGLTFQIREPQPNGNGDSRQAPATTTSDKPF